jgi:uncharacterized protein YbaR (Trm112 family)
MISEDFLELLRCPLNHGPLRNAETELVDKINSGIDAGTVRNRGAETVESRLDGGLLNQDNTLLYPIFGEIPCLLIEEAIERDQWEVEHKPS